MKLVYARVKLVIEPSAAVPLAVALYSTAFRNRAEALTKDKRRSLNVGVVFSGGNVELTRVLKLFESVEADVTLS
jgi:threonine dehydratase